jgi:hypothetical protein
MRFLCVVVALWLGADAGAQQYPNPEPEDRYYLALSPAKVADPLHRGVLYAAGMRLPGDWDVEVGHLVLFRDQPNRWGRRGVDRGQRIHLAAYHHLIEEPSPVSVRLGTRLDYLRVNYTYTYREDELQDLLTLTPGPGNPTLGLAHDVITLNGLVSVWFRLSSVLALDLQFGYGLRYRDSRLRQPAPPTLGDRPEYLGKQWTVNLPVDLRFVFLIPHRQYARPPAE